MAESRAVPHDGGYESRFVRAIEPGGPRAVWIRQTTHGDIPAAWCTVFGDGPPRAVKQSRVTALFDDAGAAGEAAAAGHRAAWELSFAGREPPLRHLPRDWLYRAPLPRTKLESPRPAIRVSGSVTIDGERLELDRWPGTTGHNWGTEHAAHWVWLHGIAFAEDATAWLDLALGRIAVGGRLSPWIANGVLARDGRRHRVGGLHRRAVVHAEPGRLAASLTGPRGLTLAVAATAPLERTVAFTYRDPGGPVHDVLNCSNAALSLRVGATTLTTAHGGAYELGGPAGTSPVPLQPYPDP
jgi:hypothetical protein